MTARVLDVQEIVDACADFMSSLIDDHNLLEGTGLELSPKNFDSEIFLQLTLEYILFPERILMERKNTRSGYSESFSSFESDVIIKSQAMKTHLQVSHFCTYL